MPQFQWHANSRTNRDVVESFKKIASSLGDRFTDPQLQIHVIDGVQALNATLHAADLPGDINEFLAFNDAAAQRLRLTFSNAPFTCNIVYDRPAVAAGTAPAPDRILVSVADGIAPVATAQVTSTVRNAFTLALYPADVEALLGADRSESIRLRNDAILRLENLTRDLAQQNIEYRAKLDDENQVLRARIQADGEAERERLLAATRTQEQVLLARATALDEREKELDDRDNTHARREIYKQLRTIITNKENAFTLRASTVDQRRPIYYAFAIIGILLASLIAATLAELVAGDGSLAVLGRLSLSMVSFILVAVYFIRWQDAWVSRLAGEEHRLHRLSLDVDRASWVVEMAFEWKEGKGIPIPAELVDRLTRNLFRESGADSGSTARHPAEDVARVLAASTSLDLNIPGVGKATIDRKGMKDLQGD